MTHDRALVEYLTTPNAPGFSPLKRRGQALPPDRAAHTQCLGYLETGRGIGEPQIGITDVARQTGNLCLGVCLGTVSTDTSCFTCFLVWWRFFESDPDQGCCGGQMSRKFGHGSCDFGSVAIWRNGADYVALT